MDRRAWLQGLGRGVGRGVRVRLAWLAAGLVVYLVLMIPLGCATVLADRLMLFPTTDPVRAFGAEDAFVQTPAGRVQVVLARSMSAVGEEPRRYVLRLEGNGGRAEFTAVYVAARWNDLPTEVWAMNYPGFGRSEGPASLSKLAPAAAAVFEAMREQAGDADIFLDGDSMGTAVALHLAATYPDDVAGLILKNPPPLRQLVLGRFGWWNLWLAAGPIAGAIPREIDSVTNAARVQSPAIVLTATNDSLVPPRYQRKVLRALAGPVTEVLFDGAEHNTPLDADVEEQLRRAIAVFARPGKDDAEAVDDAAREIDPARRGIHDP